jgi:hypothetical protein
MAHDGAREVVLGTKGLQGALYGNGLKHPRKRAVPKTGLEPVSLSAADFKSDLHRYLLVFFVLWNSLGTV